ncbi:hypothetical protein [Meiothermus taiwanensis]|nr:hypothetical protein [Meiothermus taiwanensis]
MEGEKLEGRLASLPEVEEVYEGLEGWSQILAAWLAALKKAERRP